MFITIPRVLENDIMNFVRLNNVEDVNSFLVSCLRDGFNIAKYGYSPQDNFNKENKPFKIEEYGTEEKVDIEGLEKKETKKRGRPKKQQSTEEENVKSVEERKEEQQPIKLKKTIRIIKK